MESHFYDSSIPNDVGEYSVVESNVGISENSEDGSYYGIPIIFDVNVSK